MGTCAKPSKFFFFFFLKFSTQAVGTEGTPHNWLKLKMKMTGDVGDLP